MYAVPGANAFKVTLNSETNIFFGVAEPDHELDVVTVDAPVQKTPSVVETFTIDVVTTESGATINYSWDQTLFTVTVALQ